MKKQLSKQKLLKELQLLAKALTYQDHYDYKHCSDWIQFTTGMLGYEPIGYDSWDNTILSDNPTYMDKSDYYVDEPCDFSEDSTSPSAKKLLHGSFYKYLNQHSKILELLNLDLYDFDDICGDDDLVWTSGSLAIILSPYDEDNFDSIREAIFYDCAYGHDELLDDVNHLITKLHKD